MKKVIFISALAIAAAVSCTKSDIVDTKFNEAISFETYTGRDAMTKAAVTDNSNLTEIGLYGFYTGKNPYVAASSNANLWGNEKLSKGNDGWGYTNAKYWTNADDKYTFLAYAPYATAAGDNPSVAEEEAEATYTKTDGTDASILTVKTGTSVVNPSLEYTVANKLVNQVDVLYSNNANPVTKRDEVSLTMQHALARLTVNASKSTTEQNFDFIIKKIEITGGFITTDEFTLATGLWAEAGKPVEVTTAAPGTTYSFYDNEENTELLSDEKVTEFAKVGGAYTNYLMMIPVNFKTQPAKVYVEYTTVYQNEESTINPAEFTIDTNFEKGNAYAINLVFSKDATPIEFTVSVEDWKPTTTTDGVTSTDEIDEDKPIVA